MARDGRSDEVNLIEIWRVFFRHRWLIGAFAFAGAVIGVVAALTLTPIYRAQVLLAPVVQNESGMGLGGLADQFGGVAQLAGLGNLNAADGKAESIATLGSQRFSEQFILDHDLIPVLFQDDYDEKDGRWLRDDPADVPTIRDAYEVFNEKIRRIEELGNGLVRLTIDWRDSQQAADWANAMVARVNEKLRIQAIEEAQKSIAFLRAELEKTTILELQQAIYRLTEAQINAIMLANVRQEYAFKVIDPAVPSDPDQEIRPKKVQLVLVGLFAGFFLSLLVVMILELRRQAL